MATIPVPFNPMEVEPDGGPQGMPVSGPQGYLVRIVGSSWVPVSDNPQLGRLVFDLEILEGENAGFKGKEGFNLGHSNPQTVEIAQRQLSALCYVCGVFNPVSDTAVLHGKQFKACVRQQKKNPEYTEMWKVLDIHGRTATDIKNAGPQAVAQQAAPAAQAAPAPAAAPVPQAAPAPAQAPVSRALRARLPGKAVSPSRA